MMRCRPYRARLHEWLDTPSPGSLPNELAEHVRACEDCRILVKRWNAIEVQMLAMRYETPQISPDFRESLRGRLAAPAPRFSFRMPYIDRRYALALASAIILVIVVAFSLVVRQSNSSSSLLASRAQSNNDQQQRPIPTGHLSTFPGPGSR